MRKLPIVLGSLSLGILVAVFCLFHSFIPPKISVIISSYNMGDTLPAAIHSIITQTFSDWELIIIDDGSTDNTPEVLRSYLSKDKRIHIITNPKNLGLIASLNKGLKIARGKYIARLDADDTSYPDRLARQFHFMEKYHLDLSGANFDIPNKSVDLPKPRSADFLDSDFLGFWLFFRNIFAHDTIILRKDFLDKNDLSYHPGHPHAEDYDLWLKIFLHGGKLGFMGGHPVSTYKYSRHDEAWWRISNDSFIASKKEALQKVIPHFSTENFNLLPENISCDFLQLMIEGNNQTNFLNQKKLIMFRDKYCD